MRSHFRRARIADVRVVRPHDNARRLRARKMRVEGFERFRHVTIAQIPRRHAATEHRPIVAFGVRHQPRILYGKETLVARRVVGILGHGRAAPTHAGEFSDDLVLARKRAAESNRIRIAFAVAAETIETGIVIASAFCGGWIDSIEIVQHGIDRCIETVEIEPIEAGSFGWIA